MALTRKLSWEADFAAFLRERAKLPFAWGSNDCCLFPADGVQVICGVDPAAEFRGKYQDEAGAWALIKAVTGGETVADAAAYCAVKVGMVELTHPLKAGRGDLVTIEDAGRMIAGIVHLNGSIVTMGAGILQRPITDVLRAWHY